MKLFTFPNVRFYRFGPLELCFSTCPRQNMGFYYTWQHYQKHLLTLNFYLGQGRYLAATIYN